MEDIIESFDTTEGYEVILGYMDNVWIHDFLEEYNQFFFWDRDVKHLNTLEDGRINDDYIGFCQESLGIALGILKPEDITDDKEDQQMYKARADRILKNYRVFPIWIYEHSAYKFYIGYLTDKRDSRFWGVLLIDKKKRKEYRIETEPTSEDTDYIMDIFTERFNWRLKELVILDKNKEFVDGLSYLTDYHDAETIFNENFPKSYGEKVLDSELL